MVKKIKFYNNFKISNIHKNSILLVGNFDGLHLGHQKLFRLAKKYKKKFNLKIGVVTFEPIPKMYFNKKLTNFRISNISQKIKIFIKYSEQNSKSAIESWILSHLNKVLGVSLSATLLSVKQSKIKVNPILNTNQDT